MYKKDKNITRVINKVIDVLPNAFASSISMISPNFMVFDGEIINGISMK